VEARGIEPLSENRFPLLSTSVDCSFFPSKTGNSQPFLEDSLIKPLRRRGKRRTSPPL